MLLGGAPRIVALGYAIVAWQMTRITVGLALLSLSTAVRGEMTALLPLPLAVASGVVALHAFRGAADALGAFSRR